MNEGITRIYNKIVSKTQNAPRGSEERFESVSEKESLSGRLKPDEANGFWRAGIWENAHAAQRTVWT